VATNAVVVAGRVKYAKIRNASWAEFIPYGIRCASTVVLVPWKAVPTAGAAQDQRPSGRASRTQQQLPKMRPRKIAVKMHSVTAGFDPTLCKNALLKVILTI
jgi:uncharacterized membrane protein